MDLEITPDPPEEEREAVEEALARLVGERQDPRSEWWRRGVRENVLGDDGGDLVLHATDRRRPSVRRDLRAGAGATARGGK